MKIGSIPSGWIAITGVLTAETNLALLKRVDAKGIDHKDLDAVRREWEALKAEQRTAQAGP